jgi:hypothetical protein
MNGIIEAAKSYSAIGFHLVAMKEGTKGPTTASWHTKGIDVDKLTEHQNIGLIHNLSSTCSIDIDSRNDAVKVFKNYLGLDPIEMKKVYPCYRGKRDGIKFLFKMPNIEHVGIKKLTYKNDADIVTVFELRGSTTGTGVMDVLPPSVHTQGHRYEWINPLPSQFADIPELPERLVELWQNFDVEEQGMLNCLGYFKPETVKRQLEPNVDSIDIIERFNSTYSVEQILVKHGYEKKGENRFLSPHSQTKTPGVILLEDGSIYSHHAGDLLGDGHSHDAFDVERILNANGDWKTAFNNARSDLGMPLVTYEKPIDVRAFKFFHASEAIKQATVPKWVIKGVCEEDSLIGIFGPAKSGKSFITVDMACCVATGKDYHEKKSNEGLVLYLAGEGHRGLSRRLLAWEAVNDTKLKDSKLHYSERGVQILDELDAEMMRNEALTLVDTYGEPPKLVVVDTLARNFGPGNENSTEDMNRWIANIDRFIREEFRCAVILVHHTGHGHLTRGRGSSVLPAALDWEYKVEKVDDNEEQEWSLNFEQTLVKDGRPLPPMRFNFQETEFHHLLDEEGQPTTSGALVLGKWSKPKATKKLGKNQQIVLDALKDVYARKVREARTKKEDVFEVFVTQKELKEAVNDVSRSGLSNAKKALIEEHELIEEDGREQYVPKDREMF